MYAVPVVLLSALAAVSAAPTPEQKRQAPFQITEQAPWNAGAVTEWQIHSSCNSSERYQISKGLEEAVILAQHAKDHINRWGNESELYQKYFGNRPTVEAAGSLDIIVNGDRHGALFRCDDPDENCANFPDWAGHWRGNNASDETVICPPSYELKLPLARVCSGGWNARQGSRTAYWGSDLMHRLYHMPAFGQGYVEHYAEDYEEIVEAASMNSVNATKDSYGIIYFALEAWAHDVINPGVGCPGPAVLPESSASSEAASATSTASAVSTASAAAAETTSALPENCHTHSNGDVHCSDPTATVSETASATAASAEASATESASGGGENCHTHANGELHCS